MRPGPELDKVRREVGAWERFRDLVGQVTEVNEAICEARPVSPPGAAGGDGAPPPVRGLRADLQAEASAEIGRLAAAAARSLGCDAGLEAAETVIRAGMLKLGGGMLEQLLAADSGHRGLRAPCGQGHEAEFVAYRDKTFDTVLGPVTISRAWYQATVELNSAAPVSSE